MPSVSVGALLAGRPEDAGLPLELLAGSAGLGRAINSPYVQHLSETSGGADGQLDPSRIVVVGEAETRDGQRFGAGARERMAATLCDRQVPCVLIAGESKLTPASLGAFDRVGLPVLCTPVSTPVAIARLSVRLDDLLAVREVVHGVLLDILGLGVLITGESGIGKSECALDLVVRGHRLVADDTVEVRRRGEAVLIGSCPEATRDHMEVRGLGVINIRDLFGVAATCRSKRVELVVRLERWDPGTEYDRLGLDAHFQELFGLQVPLIQMPVALGRSLAILVEVAARNQLLRARGINAARDLLSRLDRRLLDQRDQRTPSDGHEEEWL